MKAIITIIIAVATFISANAAKYSYTFKGTPMSEALLLIGKEHHDVNISFIYKDLDKYRISARIDTDDTYEALRQVIGLNPVSVIEKDGNYYIEALQHGRYSYTGRVVGTDNKPVTAALVMLLEPKDSTVVTYGITDDAGKFTIPCDSRNMLAKLTCIGYLPTFKTFDNFYVGNVTMTESPVQLQSVTIDGSNAILHSDRSVYIPTAHQKKSAQSGTDLIIRMAIPQLRMGEEIKTSSGQPVELYIDFIPATEAELSGMRMNDVKRVEYYDYPSDPRFQGDAHVINFIMQKYEYGGYVKGIYYDSFTVSRQLNGYTKVQYKDMTYDWAGGVYYKNDRVSRSESAESYRLPQTDGTLQEFERISDVSGSKIRNNSCWTSLKALYRTEKITVSNMLSLDFDHTPVERISGTVFYTPNRFASTEYTSQSSSRINSFIYNGFWYFVLPSGNTLTFNPRYAYSHTNQSSTYDESDTGIYVNGAMDDSHQASGNLTFTHSFGTSGTLKLICQGRFLQNRTYYSGTSTISDIARTYRLGPGANYDITKEKVYISAGLGLLWDKSSYGTITENSTAPWAKMSVQYSFNNKNSTSTSINYTKSIPASSYRSASVIQANPLMSYTGNPSLVPYNSFNMDFSYTFIPSNKYSLSTFGRTWIVDNRYVYDYEASATGILRTIKQPMGSYAQWQYGIQGSARLLDRKLQVRTALYIEQAHNGMPYNWTKTKPMLSASAYYYLNKLYFGATYTTPEGFPDGCMVGTWVNTCANYTFQIGWSNNDLNLRFYTRNFLRDRNTYHVEETMLSDFYDTIIYKYSPNLAQFFQISATYTFSFGKKVKAGDEAYQASGASSGILK